MGRAHLEKRARAVPGVPPTHELPASVLFSPKERLQSQMVGTRTLEMSRQAPCTPGDRELLALPA